MEACFGPALLQVGKRYQAQLATEHYAAALQRRALVALSAALAAAGEEEQQTTEVAASFARRKVLSAAWRQWEAWMELQQLRRQRLGALLANLDGAAAPRRQQLVSCWHRWQQAVQRGQRLAALADELAGRRAAALLAQVVDVWAAYSRAMRAEPDHGSPFASPRAPEEDATLVFGLAELVAGGRSSSDGSGGSHIPTSSSEAEVVERALGHTSITVAAAGTAAAPLAMDAMPAEEAGRQQKRSKRWGLGMRLFRSTR